MKIDFTGDDAFAGAFDQLCAALDLDVARHRENRSLTELALKWAAAGKPENSLMCSADIKAAERLFERRPRNAEPPPALVKDFLSIRRDRLERTSGAVAGHRPRLCETGGTCALRRRGCVHLRELAGLSPA